MGNTRRIRRILLAAVTALAAALLLHGGGPTVVVAADETLDPAFGTGGKVVTDFGGTDLASALVLQPDGKLVVAGGSAGDFLLARYLPDGGLDATFGTSGSVSTDFGGDDAAYALVLQPDGKLVAAGLVAQQGSFGLARYNPDGSLDATFGIGGQVVTSFGSGASGGLNGLALQPDGKVVAVGALGVIRLGVLLALARYLPDGSLDTTFGTDGLVVDQATATFVGFAVVVQPDSSLVVAGGGGTAGDFLLARYLSNGSADATFGTGGRVTTNFGGLETASALVRQPDGKLVAAGGLRTLFGSATPSADENFRLARYNVDGSLDGTFGFFGKVTTDFGVLEWAKALVLQPDGRLVAAGLALTPPVGSGVQQFALARYNPDGSLDGTFGSFGKVTTGFEGPASANALVLVEDGGLVAAGAVGDDVALARYLPGGTACVVNTLAALPEAQMAADITAASGARSGSAASGSKGAERGTRLDPAAFRRLRDEVLVRSPAGRRYTALYAAHSTEVVRLMFTDAALRAAILDGLLLWQPNVAALADRRGAAVAVTADQARAVDLVLDRLAKAGSPALRQAVNEERRAHAQTPGFSFAQAVLREIGREDNRR